MKNFSLREQIALLILHSICRKKNYADYVEADNRVLFEKALASSSEFFLRFNNKADFRNKTILDVGCGLGATCYYMALNGAKRVVGLDIDRKALAFAKSKLKDYPEFIGQLVFLSPEQMNNEKFDLVVSKDSFEHFQNPEQFMLALRGYLKPDGKLIIGFSPLWKSPYGGHTGTLTIMPWVHLLFPERVLVEELRRFLRDEKISSLTQIAGGLNKMVLSRFLRITQKSGLSFGFFKTNASSTFKIRYLLLIFTILAHIPGAKEYFTVNLYSILRVSTSINQ